MQALSGIDIADKIETAVPGSILSSDEKGILVYSKAIPGVMKFLKDTPQFDFNYLNSLTAVDYFDYFEVVYHLTSMKNKQSVTVKTRVNGRDNLEVPTVSNLWRGADYQEREVFDLLGIRFPGHMNLKRIALWQSFEGHPLRKDFL